MNSPIGKFNWVNVKGAIVSGLFMAVLAILANIVSAQSIYVLDLRELLNIGAVAGITAIVSLMKNFLTDENGKLAGVQIK